LIGHFLLRNCRLKHVIGGKVEGRIEVTGTKGRGRKQQMDELIEKERILERERRNTGR
jgi:hypothetical protein